LNNEEANNLRITCITGTPGTGKSTIAGLLEGKGYAILEIENFARVRGIYSYIENGETLLVDVPELMAALGRFLPELGEAFLIGHLSHNLPGADSIVVLRTRPSVLRTRLVGKGWGEGKISENLEAEALDICLGEAIELHGEKVSEIDTTDRSPAETLRMVLDVHSGRRRYPPVARDWLLEHILEESDL